ncbi:hypothetical protein [Streptomyces mangrovisoli]|uniref:Addiction module toxin RelE n=1 Tax=Streptomyces mangrovisoli TaxID=1428628 RepID=A0A1J4NXX4_9ACTN|nr:hypothetical protein [Streptomyces mangrovisoli]OIJ67203.1 hypothetical protein WN71_014455 [Streptomyces mangrovisoli]
MSPKKGDRVAPPPGRGEYDVRFGETRAVEGWREVCNKAPGNAAKAWAHMRTDPRPVEQTERHHQLKYDLAEVTFRGKRLPQWQIEITGGGRLWYLVDEESRKVWLVYASLRHPKATD